MRSEMDSAGTKHRKIAANIRELVVYPFSRWCDQHAARVQGSQDDLQARVKAHDRQSDAVRKLRSHYFNKCRLVEDLEEEDKLAFKEPAVTTSPVNSPKPDTPTVKVSEPDDEDAEEEVFEIGDNVYQKEQMKKMLSHVLDNVRLGETRVPILGTYQNTTTGAEIVEYIQKHMDGSSVSYSERIGQDLIKNGFLRLVGNVGSVFANSSRMNYQWRPKVFKLTGYPERRVPLGRSSTVLSTDSMGVDSPLVSNVTEYLAGLNPLNNPHPNETPGMRLRREAREADDRYKLGVKKLDSLRCNLEESMVDHLKFMERCELDRLRAIKSVILDFSGAISNTIPSLQSTVDKMMLFQETVQPQGDLRYLLENYRTGPFVPRVQPYENYYNSVDDLTFGVDLEARARSDKKRVPLVVTAILMHLDNSKTPGEPCAHSVQALTSCPQTILCSTVTRLVAASGPSTYPWLRPTNCERSSTQESTPRHLPTSCPSTKSRLWRLASNCTCSSCRIPLSPLGSTKSSRRCTPRPRRREPTTRPHQRASVSSRTLSDSCGWPTLLHSMP